MLIHEVFRYLKRRADKRPVRLSNIVSMGNHHGQRSAEPKVAIIIPTRDKYGLLCGCIESIQKKTTYRNYEIVVINNGSNEVSTIEYLNHLRSTGISVLDYPYEFNFSKISNFGADHTDSDYLCFLNNDTEVIDPRWLSNLMDHGVQSGTGVVGSKLLYPNGEVQHVGVALGYTGAAGHPYSRYSNDDVNLKTISESCFEVSAVTFACALTSRKNFYELSGLNEGYKVGLSDVDYSLQLKKRGLNNIVCCRSALYHHESQSRPLAKSLRGFLTATGEILRFIKANGQFLEKEPYWTRETS